MKYIILTFFFVISFTGFSQITEIEDGEWRLDDLIIDNENISPINSRNSAVTSIFLTFDNGTRHLNTWICDSMGCTLDFDSDNLTFTIYNRGITLGGCHFDENIDNPQLVLDFERAFFNFFSYNGTFNYEIIENNSDNSKTLTITDVNGNKAIYSNKVLSARKFSSLHFSISSNPVKDKLTIVSVNNSQSLKFQVFDFSGKIAIKKQKLHSKSINVDKLSSGVYFIQIENELGNIGIKKFVK